MPNERNAHTSHPRKRARQERALARRGYELQQLQVNPIGTVREMGFSGLDDGDILTLAVDKVVRAEQDITNLEAKLGR